MLGDFGDFDFDDDIFDNTAKKAEDNLAEQIRNYQAKQVNFESFLDEQVNPDEPEDSASLLKMKGDYSYYNKNYGKALEFYQESLELTKKAIKGFHDKKSIKDREVSDNIARCLVHLNRFSEAIQIAEKFIELDGPTLNFDAYSTSLNLKIDILISHKVINNNEDIKIINDELVTIEKLIVLHPLFCQLWIKLGDSIYSMNLAENFNNTELKTHYLVCYCFVNFIFNHYFLCKNSIVQKQKQKQQNWLNEAESNLKKMKINLEEILKNNENLNSTINEKLEKADKLDDNERQVYAKSFIKHEQFAKFFFIN